MVLISFVVVKFHERIMITSIVFSLSTIFVIGFVGFSSKPSPVYGGLGLTLSGGVGCGIVLNFGEFFLGLMVFLGYLDGMLVIFGYAMTMATEQYHEVCVSKKTVLGIFLSGLIMEFSMAFYTLKDEEVEVVFKFHDQGD